MGLLHSLLRNTLSGDHVSQHPPHPLSHRRLWGSVTFGKCLSVILSLHCFIFSFLVWYATDAGEETHGAYVFVMAKMGTFYSDTNGMCCGSARCRAQARE